MKQLMDDNGKKKNKGKENEGKTNQRKKGVSGGLKKKKSW